MSSSDDSVDFYNLRSRKVIKPNTELPSKIQPRCNNTPTSIQEISFGNIRRIIPESEAQFRLDNSQTSTPVKERTLEEIRETIQGSTSLIRKVSNLLQPVDKNLSVQNLSSIYLVSADTSSRNMAQAYNKDLSDLMAANIPRFELNSCNNPSLELRAFIKSCENVLNLFPVEDIQTREEFFKLIKFRLGFDVQERITMEKFENIKELESHLRAICHIKLNRGKLLSEIRREKQFDTEDVSKFIERLRKLIAQGRTEYPKDTEFEREAVHSLKNCIKNELISFKLMDSETTKFEELAEIAINRDCELRQRSYNSMKSEATSSKELINELIEKIKKLEANQTANIQHIRHESRFREKSPIKKLLPISRNSFCSFCNRSGHSLNECRSKDTRNKRIFHDNFRAHFNNPNSSWNQSQPNRQYGEQYGVPIRQNQASRGFITTGMILTHGSIKVITTNITIPHTRNNETNQTEIAVTTQLLIMNRVVTPITKEEPIVCVRCNKPGHKSNNCYEIICGICKEFGHGQQQCQANRKKVQFSNSGNQNNSGNE